MPLKGVPKSITPELLYALARMGHGDYLVISDSIANDCKIPLPIRVSGKTSIILRDILQLIPLDSYSETPVVVMDRVQSDKDRNLIVPAYEELQSVANLSLTYLERFQFYEAAKGAFCVVQTDDHTLYANVIVYKGVL